MLIPVLVHDGRAPWFLSIPACLHVLHIAQLSHNTGKGGIVSGIRDNGSEKRLFVCYNIGYGIIGLYPFVSILAYFLISSLLPAFQTFLYETSLGGLILETIYIAVIYLICFKWFSKKEFIVNSKKIIYKRSFGILEYRKRFVINETCFAFYIYGEQSSFLDLYKYGEQSLYLEIIGYSNTNFKTFYLENMDRNTVIDFFQPYLPYKTKRPF
jgi:hypothetical protein